MIDHIGIFASPAIFQATLAFYDAVLAPLGYTQRSSLVDGQVIGFGTSETSVDFWVGSTALKPGQDAGYIHFAFGAKDRETVDKAYAKGMEAGGKDNGKPGERPYHPGYYAGFVLDPVGNGIEIVNHGF